jgi:hypothetical protein
MIGGDHDKAVTRQPLSQNCVDGRHDTGAVFHKDNWERAALSDGCLESGMRAHEALKTRLQFPLFGQRIRNPYARPWKKCLSPVEPELHRTPHSQQNHLTLRSQKIKCQARRLGGERHRGNFHRRNQVRT